MVTEIYKNIYLIEVPLPKNPLRALNAYLIKGDERNLLIDTGFNRDECKKALQEGLGEIGVNMDNTDIFITHLHSDHSGLASDFATESSKIYTSEKAGHAVNLLREFDLWKENFKSAKRLGFEGKINDYLERHPGFRFSNTHKLEFTYIKDGDELKIGDYTLRCISTPGHTEGLMCLYEEDHKILFSADHILGRITPNISVWGFETDALGDYYRSLDKIKELKVERVFPSHRHLFNNCHERIEELKQHHEKRLAEVETILDGEVKSAYEVASFMKWDMSFKSWDEFPHVQKWFATGEAMAHLVYLYNQNRVKLEKENEIYKFYK
jgi:glyoxylase-like metal-dependent hydrolase (beta-lactamase superfamily II)